MNLDQIETKCFILALFIRDDGERFLLGSRAYEFVDSQLHFAANSYQNDIVEVQGNDGLMLAGQVRRGTAQVFDGYIGDSSVSRSDIEQYRRDFMAFFRKNHYYKVVYVFPDGTAIQRRQGFIVEAPEVQELYQLFPQYHIAMNFEDINYYNYEEDSDGQEIYGESASLKVATSATGGLIWEEITSTTLSGEGSSFTLNGTVGGNAISNVQLKGDTTQQTYSGKNLCSSAVRQSNNALRFFCETNKLTKTFSLSVDSTVTLSGVSLNIYYGSSNQFSVGTADFVEGERLEVTFTMTDEQYAQVTSGNGTYMQFYKTNGFTDFGTPQNAQIENNSSVTAFEPYVGGIPAPNPDYPQLVQVVTGDQTIDIYNKNLWGMSSITATSGSVTISGPDSTGEYSLTWGGAFTAELSSVMNLNSSSYYAISFKHKGAAISLQRVGGAVMVTTDDDSDYTTYSFVLSGETELNFELIRRGLTTGVTAYVKEFQVEIGSTATPYQTHQSYEVDLGSIELCKLGTYQDYIYKSGSDWYIHKATSKITYDGSENWSYQSSNTRCYIATPSGADPGNDYAYCTHFVRGSTVSLNNTFSIGVTNTYFRSTSITTSESNWTTWLTSNNITMYYALSTPTDTQITNASLIAQLEALSGATTYNSQTIFTVTSANQLGILSLSTIGAGGGGVVWDSYGAEWEQGTGGGPTMIDIQSIDNVYPVWTVTGPAINPQISVLTTNTTLSYSGTVTASQELTVDMFNKTATLNGVSVVGNVSGDWVYLKPGINRVTYTTNNADAPDSTIWWQEIVG